MKRLLIPLACSALVLGACGNDSTPNAPETKNPPPAKEETADPNDQDEALDVEDGNEKGIDVAEPEPSVDVNDAEALRTFAERNLSEEGRVEAVDAKDGEVAFDVALLDDVSFALFYNDVTERLRATEGWTSVTAHNTTTESTVTLMRDVIEDEAMRLESIATQLAGEGEPSETKATPADGTSGEGTAPDVPSGSKSDANR